MLTPITSIKEIVSMVPDTPRKFQINKDELMGIDPTKAIAARTFKGVLIKSNDDIVTNEETCNFIEVFYEGDINITTLLSDELKKLLFKDTSKELDTRELPTSNPYNTHNFHRGDINSWD